MGLFSWRVYFFSHRMTEQRKMKEQIWPNEARRTTEFVYHGSVGERLFIAEWVTWAPVSLKNPIPD